MVNFYQVGSAWLVGDNYLPKGSCLAVVTADNTMVSIRLISNSHQVAYCPISSLQNESGVAYNLTTFLAAFDSFAGADAVTYANLTAELTRPADTNNYDAGDAINSATVAVKQKEIITLSGSAPAKKKTTITLTGTMPRKDKYTVTLTGTSGTAEIKLVGGLTKLVTFATGGTTDLTQTAADFVTSHAAAYLAVGVTCTANLETIVFEHVSFGTALVAPTITNKTTDLAGTVAHTTTPYGIGTANINGVAGAPFLVTAHTSLTQTAADFVTAYASDFSDIGIDLKSSGADLTFEALVAGTDFQTLSIANLTQNLNGTLVETTANVVVGEANISFMTDFGTSFGVTFDTSLDDTAAAFVTANATTLHGLGIVVTSSTNTLIFEAHDAGVPFTAPTISTTKGDLAGTVEHNTANVTISPVVISNAVNKTGGSIVIKEVKVETDSTVFATKKLRLWLFNATPTGVKGDNVAYINLTGDAGKRNAYAYIDITFDALVTNSTTVIGKAQPNALFTSTNKNLYMIVQSVDAVATPASGAKFRIDMIVEKL